MISMNVSFGAYRVWYEILRKLYRSNRHYMLEFEETKRLPNKCHREQVIIILK